CWRTWAGRARERVARRRARHHRNSRRSVMSGSPAALIAEDEPLLRAMLRTRLAESWPELAIVGEAANGEEAVAMAHSLRPAVAFLDIRMPLKSGLDAAREIGAQCHVVFVTAYDEYAVAAFDDGALAYVLK